MLHQVNVANGFGRDYAQEAALALVGPQIEHYKKFGLWQDLEVAGWIFSAGEAGWILKCLIRPSRSLLTRSFDDLLPVAHNGAVTTGAKGELAEAAARRTLGRAGYEELPARLARNNGFDGVFVKRSAVGEIEDIIIFESKFSVSGRASLTKTKTMGKQLSSEWIDANIQKMLNSADPAVRRTGMLLDTNRSLIRRKANVLDPAGVNRWNRIRIPER
jgi:hypothetical protein